jgi:ribosomal 30S subunit maturation factor RimM
MEYSVDSQRDCTVVTVHYNQNNTTIKFEGYDHMTNAMEFLAKHIMVQMGQIGI